MEAVPIASTSKSVAVPVSNDPDPAMDYDGQAFDGEQAERVSLRPGRDTARQAYILLSNVLSITVQTHFYLVSPTWHFYRRSRGPSTPWPSPSRPRSRRGP